MTLHYKLEIIKGGEGGENRVKEKNVKIKKEDKQRLKHLCPRHSHNSHCFLLTYSSILNVDGWGGRWGERLVRCRVVYLVIFL